MEEAKQKSVITTMDVDGMTQFSDLPSCLVIDILLRLPITTLLTCICVCKDWIRLLRDPSFVKLHLAASPIHILNRQRLRKDGAAFFQIGQVMEEDLEVKTVSLPTNVKLIDMPHSTEIYDYWINNSCNGLVCLADQFARSFCVCNPILGEWVSISTPVRKYNPSAITMALVFSAKNNQYKLLHGFKTKKVCGFEIYTLGGTRQWRNIDETLGCGPGFSHFDEFNTFLHGSLHGIDPTGEFICCFDADNEKFRRLSLPPIEKREPRQLGVINGWLCALFFKLSGQTDDVPLWAMKEYGVEKSWVMIFNFNACVVSFPYPLYSQNEEEMLIYDYHRGLFSCNLKNKRTCQGKKVDFSYVVSYNPSFISLQDVAKGEQVMLSRTMQVIQ